MKAWFKKWFGGSPKVLTNQQWYLIDGNRNIIEDRWSERPTGPLLSNVQAHRGLSWKTKEDYLNGK